MYSYMYVYHCNGCILNTVKWLLIIHQFMYVCICVNAECMILEHVLYLPVIIIIGQTNVNMINKYTDCITPQQFMEFLMVIVDLSWIKSF